jgi:hypothetical protein
MSEVNAENPPEYQVGSLLWRLKYAYDNPHREFLLIEAGMEIERLREQVRALEAERDQWQTKAVSRD